MAPIEFNSAISATAYSPAAKAAVGEKTREKMPMPPMPSDDAPGKILLTPEEQSYNNLVRAIPNLTANLENIANRYGIKRGNEIAADRAHALGIIETARQKKLLTRDVLNAFSYFYNHIAQYIYMSQDRSTFELAYSLFREANEKIGMIVNEAVTPGEICKGMDSLLEEIAGRDDNPEFYKKYGVKLLFSSDELLPREKSRIWHRTGKKSYLRDIPVYNRDIIIHRFDYVFSRFPSELYKMFPKRVSISTDEGGGEVTSSESIFVTPHEETIYHELYHIFDRASLDLGAFDRMFLPENWAWWKISHRERPDKSLWECGVFKDRPAGYTSEYGKTNPNEDQAEVAAMLFTVNSEELRTVLFVDGRLKVKVELITGCQYDPATGRFVKVYTDNELKAKYGLDHQLYFAKWSNVKSRVLMDALYWNNILDQNAKPEDEQK